MGTKESAGELAGIGLTETEEQVYLDLLRLGGGSAADVAAYSVVAPGALRAALVELEKIGLVGRLRGRPTRYWPAPPETAIEMLVVQKQIQLEQARHAAGRLAAQFAPAPTATPATVFEVLAGGAAVENRNKQLLTEARREIVAFTRPPLTTPTPEYTAFKLALLRKGVIGRVVYSLDALELPGVVEFIETMQPAGEEARVVPALSMPLLIVDRRVAFLPLAPDKLNTADDFVQIHRSAVLDALLSLFEATWEPAVPFGAATVAADGSDDPAPAAEDRRLLSLLATGMKDIGVARQLGVTPRTVERRLKRMMQQLGTRTRFQTAAEAARRGWIATDQGRVAGSVS